MAKSGDTKRAGALGLPAGAPLRKSGCSAGDPHEERCGLVADGLDCHMCSPPRESWWVDRAAVYMGRAGRARGVGGPIACPSAPVSRAGPWSAERREVRSACRPTSSTQELVRRRRSRASSICATTISRRAILRRSTSSAWAGPSGRSPGRTGEHRGGSAARAPARPHPPARQQPARARLDHCLRVRRPCARRCAANSARVRRRLLRLLALASTGTW